MGTPGDKATKKARMRAHDVFDQLWKEKHMSRHEAYEWMCDQMSLTREEAHIGRFNIDQCEELEVHVDEYFEELEDK